MRVNGFDLSPHQDNIFVISAPKPIGIEGKKKRLYPRASRLAGYSGSLGRLLLSLRNILMLRLLKLEQPSKQLLETRKKKTRDGHGLKTRITQKGEYG